MKESIITNKVFQTIIRLVTALSFTLFLAYQIYLAIQVDENRLGRLIGIGFYLLITVAAFLDFPESYGAWMAHAVLLVAGLVLLFVMRLLSAPTIFGSLNFADIPSVLNAAVYILSQLGTLVLIVGYIVLRADLTERELEKLVTILMTAVIVIYTACFVMECVLIIKYRMNIDSSRKLTLISRLMYFLGYAGTAVGLLLPVPDKTEPEQEGQFIYSDEEEQEDDIELVI